VLLPLLGAAAKQNHEPLSVFAEIHPIPGTKVDPALEYTGTHPFEVREIAASQSRQGRFTA